ncbi:hypothetical protein [Burkholderia sp. L27(2015)]|uniref:hypothetical protein n=1 Tax=Burkholderia sp. L27(2015) TaxID=1641858 RepID=UPI00131B1672|nr:hypothetical protein [Burkholderia sp. L27(2015)]
MLHIRLEKLRFVVMEMRLAMRLAQFAPTDADARMLTRHVLIRAVDFISHARQIRKPLTKAGYDTGAFNTLKEYYAKEFQEYFQKVRDRLSAHVQDIELSEGIELWNGVDAAKSEFFVEGAAEIYRALELLSIANFPALTDFPEFGNPAFEEALRAYQASGSKVQAVEMGMDPLAMTRPDSTALISTHPIHARAGHLALLQRWMMAQAKLLRKFETFPNVVRILKARMITDLVSACDCLITRDVDPAAPQRMDGLDFLLAKEVSQNAIEQFKAIFRVDEAITPYREIRNKVSSHLDENINVTLETLLKFLDDADFEAGLGIYDKLRQVFEKACRDILILRSYLADGQTINGVLGSGNGTHTAPFSDGEQPGRVIPQRDRMEDTDVAYSSKLEEWLVGEPATQGRARSAFWNAFLHSPVVEKYETVELFPGGGERRETHSLRHAHHFILARLESETDPNRIFRTLELTRQCSNGAPADLTEILLRYTRNPKSAPYMSAIALCFGDLANWDDLRVRTYLMAGLSVTSSLAVHTRVALLRIFVRTEGLARINRKPPTEDFSNVLGHLTRGLRLEAKLMTEIFLASQFCDQRVATFVKPFEKDYAVLQADIVALVYSLTPVKEASRISEMVRRLAGTHDYTGVCLYLYDELKGSRLEFLVKDLIGMACDGIVKAAYHDQSRKHWCGCFLRLERNREALAIAESLALSNPDSPDFQILLAQVMTSLPECREAVPSLTSNIKCRYRLSDDQLAALEAVRSAGSNPAENER